MQPVISMAAPPLVLLARSRRMDEFSAHSGMNCLNHWSLILDRGLVGETCALRKHSGTFL